VPTLSVVLAVRRCECRKPTQWTIVFRPRSAEKRLAGRDNSRDGRTKVRPIFLCDGSLAGPAIKADDKGDNGDVMRVSFIIAPASKLIGGRGNVVNAGLLVGRVRNIR